MAKRQVNIRISDATRAKLDRLIAHYGTQTEVIAVAIERLHSETERDELQAPLYADEARKKYFEARLAEGAK